MIQTMENNYVHGSKGSTRRAFLSASAVTAVAAPILTHAAPAGAATAGAGSALTRRGHDHDLRAMLREVDPARIWPPLPARPRRSWEPQSGRLPGASALVR